MKFELSDVMSEVARVAALARETRDLLAGFHAAKLNQLTESLNRAAAQLEAAAQTHTPKESQK